ncbi:dephospho-CoA kinase [Lactococcus allomyrinae]|uniref:Dephospho-CoA kinase n=1 Tax=Lactococcus allomyrinae TaxID=2419773 RepID=A0A387BDE5_9LACT|nr:dephospho-CoA kinase [Lactococcus allomyrinae]AYG01873.1 dephospho-CoA kinase [Lactococcus allomyrinae]
MKKVIGLTGGIASGKSTVVDFLVSRGFQVIDADKVVRELQKPDGKLYQAILTEFGAEFFDENRQLNREKLGRLIFADRVQREKLSALQDKIIREELYYKRDELLSVLTEHSIIFMDIPLLIEYNYTGFDEIWLVIVPESVQLKRLMARNHLSEKEARSRISTQMSMTEKQKFADRVFDNSGTIEQLQSQVQQALEDLCPTDHS